MINQKKIKVVFVILYLSFRIQEKVVKTYIFGNCFFNINLFKTLMAKGVLKLYLFKKQPPQNSSSYNFTK